MERVWNTLDGQQVVVEVEKSWVGKAFHETPVQRARSGGISPTASGPGTAWARGHEGSYGRHPAVALPVPRSTPVQPRLPRGKGDGLKPIIVRRNRRTVTPPKAVERFGKADEPKYTRGRARTATLVGGWHSAIAGKPGAKLRATGRSAGENIGGAVGGGLAGHLIGRAVSRGRPAGAVAGQLAGQLGGSYAGNYHAFRANNRKGRYKPQG